MIRRSTSVMILAASLAAGCLFAAERGGKPAPKRGAQHESGKKEAPGGEWSEPQHHSGQKPPQSGAGSGGKKTEGKKPEGGSTGAKNPAEGAAAQGTGKSIQANSTQGAAAGAAAENRSISGLCNPQSTIRDQP